MQIRDEGYKGKNNTIPWDHETPDSYVEKLRKARRLDAVLLDI